MLRALAVMGLCLLSILSVSVRDVSAQDSVDCSLFDGDSNQADCELALAYAAEAEENLSTVLRDTLDRCGYYTERVTEETLVDCMARAYALRTVEQLPSGAFSMGWLGLSPFFQRSPTCLAFIKYTQAISAAVGGDKFSGKAEADSHNCRKLAEIADARGIETKWTNCILDETKCSPEPSDELDVKFRRTMLALRTGAPVNFDDDSYLFIAGVTAWLLDNCRGAASGDLKTSLTSFATTGGLHAGLSKLEGSFESMTADAGSKTATFLAGIFAAKAVGCDKAAGILKNINEAVEESKLGRDGGPAPFIASCSPVHGESACGCAAELGRAAIPNLYQTPYSHDVMAEIIASNPLAALAIAGTCGIQSY